MTKKKSWSQKKYIKEYAEILISIIIFGIIKKKLFPCNLAYSPFHIFMKYLFLPTYLQIHLKSYY